MRPTRIDRRTLLRAATAGAAAALPWSAGRAAEGAARLRVAALFAGKIDDRGFMQAGYDGLTLAARTVPAEIEFTQGIAPQPDALAAALRALAQKKPDLVVAHGGQNNAATRTVAAEFPDIAFVVTQGNVTGPNLASYEVLQEQSAFLAGALAGLITKTGVVGHMSGIRVVPGLKGRAGYAAGVAHTNPKAKLLTNFSGNQDDNALSKKIATAMIAAGADVVFTMLNAGRMGAVEACRERGVPQIGNVVDWTTIVPDVFIASACADSGRAVVQAVADKAAGRFAAGSIRQVGLETPEAVRLAMAPRVPEEVRARIAAIAAEIVAGRLAVPHEWSGEEFPTPA
ncbi:BMP family ABC transporter substrate-binding protein [Rhodoplanes elegans]|uniref:BMP family ABC transporter substrate-binding protein n=1 Tax=Rhodoplanes elegans TaxID=29408 RepID=A0A327L0S2_9BRAD|nr:BMP family protein [Rhodoplanes elegans]MBK5957640.1 BMP family ABC transporter substrate-binding protein [Rhodoplanes elegans]RAI41268.1 BMP family ABC transporter substrate-binding protein [Rhodoplanes elegans]